MSGSKKGVINLLQEFSIPLIAGVFCALIAANVNIDWYEHWFGAAHAGAEADHGPFTFGFSIFGHPVGLHFLINDIFMVFFFGIAAKEITEACLPGGSLNPPKKAINPLLATIGGVAGPVGCFFLFMWMATQMGPYQTASPEQLANLNRGWGIPTATDIALAWLFARAVFGKGHPAINYLLLLAVADDAIGLGIIAIFYGDPLNPANPTWLLLVVAGMFVAFIMRKRNVMSWVPYIFVAGPLAWCGLMLAHLHPALALCFIVPFLPPPKRDTGLFAAADEVDKMGDEVAHDLEIDHSPLHMFELKTKTFVDFGLFFFAMGNAGVQLGGIGMMTWIILGSLVVGKTVGVTAMAMLGKAMGFSLPEGMGFKEVVMAGFVAALGLTVALFVAGAAFPGPNAEILALQGEAKMGALFSGFVGIVAILIARMVGIGSKGKGKESPSEDSDREAA